MRHISWSNLDNGDIPDNISFLLLKISVNIFDQINQLNRLSSFQIMFNVDI